VLGILGAASCETLNIGNTPDPNRFQITGVSFSSTTPVAGSDVTATINFMGVSGPFTFNVNFADCVTPATQTVTAPAGATSATLTFTLDAFLLADDPDGKDCNVTVNGSDANGSLSTVTGSFHVTGIPNQLPTISGVFNAADCSVTVTVADADNEDVTVAVTGTTDTNDPADQVVTGGNGTATFFFSPTDIVAGADSDVTFTATDASGGAATTPAVVHVTCPGFTPAADTLYAIPLSTTTTVGTPVTVLVFTGDPANPFQYMTGVRVVTTAAVGDFDYDSGSFNVGMPGGAADDVDGIWSAMGINNGDFLLAPDSFYNPVDAGGGLTGLDFNVTPLGGSDLTGSENGALFNFGATFSTPGTYTLGFQQTNVVNRTYYQDGNQAPDYFWADITNNHAGIPNSVTVN
jgi:hypothetical protein